MSMDDIDAPPKADPMAAARAAKAQKAADKANADSMVAEAMAAPARTKQPTVSKLRGRAAAPTYEGELVEVRVTAFGHNHISTGGEFGFERYARGAILQIPEINARSLFEKKYVEPTDYAFSDKWQMDKAREDVLGMRAKAREEHVLEHGVNANEHWSTAATNG